MTHLAIEPGNAVVLFLRLASEFGILFFKQTFLLFSPFLWENDTLYQCDRYSSQKEALIPSVFGAGGCF